MGKPLAVASIIALAALPRLASAHGMPPAPAHGGRVLEANENWVELVLAGDHVQVFVLDETRKLVSAAKIAGTVRVLVAGKPYKVKLSAGGSNKLDGQLPTSASPKDAAVVSLTIDGQPASARYPAGA